MLIDHPSGNFTFIKGIGPYSLGCRAQPGYEVVHVRFHPLPPLEHGYTLIERHLDSLNRPIQAVCGMELRVPAQLTSAAFTEFNQPYLRRLENWRLMVDGLNPVARTNVAPAVLPVSEPSLYGFSYTVPTHAAGADSAGTSFVLSGSAEIRRTDAETPPEIVSRGDVSSIGLGRKATFVLEELTARLQHLEVAWTDVTTVQLYTVHDVHPLLETGLLPTLARAGRHGVVWHYARPPVQEIEFEMDARGVQQERVVPG